VPGVEVRVVDEVVASAPGRASGAAGVRERPLMSRWRRPTGEAIAAAWR